MNPKPLQTHGLTEWAPPIAGRFVGYDYRDKSWMEPLGLGRRVVMPLFDVRDEFDLLVGYVEVDPTTRPIIQLMLIDEPDNSFRPPTRYEPPAFRDVRLFARRYGIGDERFVCWCCESKDSAGLIHGRFIKAIGQDNLHKYVSELRYRQRCRQYELSGMR